MSAISEHVVFIHAYYRKREIPELSALSGSLDIKIGQSYYNKGLVQSLKCSRKRRHGDCIADLLTTLTAAVVHSRNRDTTKANELLEIGRDYLIAREHKRLTKGIRRAIKIADDWYKR